MSKRNSRNLQFVLRQCIEESGLNPHALAKAVSMPTPTINRLLTGDVKNPRASTLEVIADYFNISVDQLLGRKEIESLKNSNEEYRHTLSVLSLEECVPSFKITPNTQVYKWLSTQDTKKDAYFAIKISNDINSPIFNKGTVVIVDTKKSISIGDYVVVSYKDKSPATIKKYISEGKKKYLYSLTQGISPSELTAEQSIFGVIIESINFF